VRLQGPVRGADRSRFPSTLHVAQFQPVTKESGGLGSLHTINSALPTHRVDANAAALSRAPVASLLKAHFTAQALLPNDSLQSTNVSNAHMMAQPMANADLEPAPLQMAGIRSCMSTWNNTLFMK
jgi:hypothetical protein